MHLPDFCSDSVDIIGILSTPGPQKMHLTTPATNSLFLASGGARNDNIHAIVRQSGRSYKVRIDLEDYKGFPAYAAYSDFYVDSEETNYTLYLGQYSGNAGDAMMDVDQDSLSGMRFSTWDRDNDESHFHCSYRKGLMTVHVLTAMDFILDILTFLDIRIGVLIQLSQMGKFRNKNEGKFGKIEDTAAEKSDYSVSGFSSGGKGSGSSSDDDEGDDWFKKIKKESPSIQKSKDNRTYYQSKDGTKWYSRYHAGQGGSRVKKYRNTGKTLELEGSLNGRGRRMQGKTQIWKTPDYS
ncbi:unnamed protein product [Mytilus coruscus]|uniref:Fibrinogen C-terminal domain-containing protein n=1 Tax=Mytilus coruscus TaxID=42192 RepID=A0A6J8CG29_MYTCO|nr:unnamed protein product [Mytilus coruscus]